MSFRHHLALFKDHSCLLLPTISRHFPRFPAKKMSQAVVASQYGRRSRGPGRVPRAAPRQPGCTAEQTNHEPRSFLALGASRREFQGFHETRITAFFRRGCARVAPPETAVRTTAPAGRSLFPGSPLFTIVHDCSLLFAIVQMKILSGASLHVSPRGEAKCVRGPSGRGASRLARAGVLYGSEAVKHFFWSKPSPLPEVFTNHETRNTNHGLFFACFDRRVVRNAG